VCVAWSIDDELSSRLNLFSLFASGGHVRKHAENSVTNLIRLFFFFLKKKNVY
jgi:hypothetical protein